VRPEDRVEHRCAGTRTSVVEIFYGPSYIYDDWNPEKGWTMEMQEYRAQVHYCPFCGFQLDTTNDEGGR